MVNKNIIDIQNAKFVVTNTGFFGIDTTNPSVKFQVGTTLYVNDTDGKVGIGILDPDENLEVDGSIQIDSDVAARLKFQHSGNPQTAHALGEIDAEQDPVGGNGGDLQFYTKVNGGNVTEKLRINNIGAISIGGGATYGTAGQFLKSNGSGSAVSWDTALTGQTAPLYVNLTNDRVGIGIIDPKEKLDVDSVIQITAQTASRASLYFSQVIGRELKQDLAQISSELSGTTNGCDIQFWTTDNATRTRKITINEKGAIGIGSPPNYGTTGQFLMSNGSNSALIWDTPVDTTYSQGTGVTINGSNVISIGQDVSRNANVVFDSLTIGSLLNSPFGASSEGAQLNNSNLSIIDTTISIGTNNNKGIPGQTIVSNGTNPIYWGSGANNTVWTPYVEPFGLANIGGLVTIDNQTTYYSSFYTSSALSYDRIILYTTEATVSFTGHIGVAIFDSNNSSVGTNKLQEAIVEYTNVISSGQELLINFPNSVILNSNTKYWIGIAVDSSSILGIAKASSVDTDNIHIRKESSTNFTSSGFGSVVSTTNSDLNFWYRLYNSQVSTFNDFTDLKSELSLFEVNGSNVVSKFTINNQGAFGLGTNPNFGTDGQVLTSQGTNTAIWGPPNKYYFYHGDYEPFGLGCLGGFVGMNAGDIYYSAFYTSNAVDYKKITLYTSEDFISFIGNLGVAIYSDSVNLPGNLLFKHKETYSNSPGAGSFELDLTLDETFSLNSHTKYWLGVSVNTTNSGTMGLAKALITDTDNVHIRKGTGYTTATAFPTNAGVSFTDSPLNFWFRLYNPDATSFNQQTDSPDSLSIFKTNVDLLEAKIETESDVSGTGSSLIFKTLDSAGVLTERLSINNRGALGLSGNYGIAGDVLTSQNPLAPVWTTPSNVPKIAYYQISSDQDIGNSTWETMEYNNTPVYNTIGTDVSMATNGVVTFATGGMYKIEIKTRIYNSSGQGKEGNNRIRLNASTDLSLADHLLSSANIKRLTITDFVVHNFADGDSFEVGVAFLTEILGTELKVLPLSWLLITKLF